MHNLRFGGTENRDIYRYGYSVEHGSDTRLKYWMGVYDGRNTRNMENFWNGCRIRIYIMTIIPYTEVDGI